MVIYSLGEHVMMSALSSLSMRFAKKETGGAALGLAGAIGQAGNISGYAIAALLFAVFAHLGYSRNALFSFKSMFFLATIFGIAAFAFVVCMKEPRGGCHVQRWRFYFAKKFTKSIFWKCSTASANSPFIVVSDAKIFSAFLASRRLTPKQFA
jgi:MFS family permease